MSKAVKLDTMPAVIYAHQSEYNLGLAGGWRREKLYMTESVKYVRADFQQSPSLEAIIAKIEAEKKPIADIVTTKNNNEDLCNIIENEALDKAISIIRKEGGE